MNFPNFNAWHKVPKDATIPAGTPYWCYVSEEDHGSYYGRGTVRDLGPWGRRPEFDYYTEQPIPDPDEEAIWARAEKMYSAAYPSLDDAWGWHSQDTKDRWYALAKKYVEKED